MDIQLEIIENFNRYKDAILRGDFEKLVSLSFCGFELHDEGDGEYIVTLKLKDDVLAQLPDTHKHIDIFILPAQQNLGAHYHVNVNAEIEFLQGHGTAHIDGKDTPFQPGTTARFPAGVVHDVIAGDQTVVLVSYQDNPIIKPDRTLDYHPV